MKPSRTDKSILLTFDVEDWFQVENFKEYIPFSSWSSLELRVEKNTHVILDLLDSFEFKPKGTFFILGWIAKKVPGLIREICSRGHEVASHGNDHRICTRLAPEDLMADFKSSKLFLEDLTGEAVHGYRAPSFVMTDTILTLVKNAGYLYDSSYNSFAMHDRYGKVCLSNTQKLGVSYKFDEGFFGLPVSNLCIKGHIFPLGGGGYFRLMPFSFFKQGIKRNLSIEDAFVFYSHPWEFDPEQPKVSKAKTVFRFRHYINLSRNLKKLERMIETFEKAAFISCSSYIKSQLLSKV